MHVFFLTISLPLFLLSCLNSGTAGVEQSTSSSSSGKQNTSPAPQFIFIGADDNDGDGMPLLLDWFSGKVNPESSTGETFCATLPTQMTFFSNTTYGGANWYAWHKRAVKEGHELGNHTHSHPSNMDLATATAEISQQHTSMKSEVWPGGDVPAGQLTGFRTPYLEVNDDVLDAVSQVDYSYDCSVESGWSSETTGENMPWPYQLKGKQDNSLSRNHPALWEIPVNPLIVPTDSACDAYGVPQMRKRMLAEDDSLEYRSWKITGFDYNFWTLYKMTPEDFHSILRFNLDQRYESNRSPLSFGIHSRYYGSKQDQQRAALLEFFEYAITKKDICFVTGSRLVEWMKR